MTRFDIYTADECFLTGTAAEVIAAVQYDRRPIGDGKPGKITNELITTLQSAGQQHRHAGALRLNRPFLTRFPSGKPAQTA
jgi:branched-subunit amino acid aminotransferase/4-amino-4-deoxychorismate lyase